MGKKKRKDPPPQPDTPAPAPLEPGAAHEGVREERFWRQLEGLRSRNLSNTESVSRAVLTIGASGLFVAVAFAKDAVAIVAGRPVWPLQALVLLVAATVVLMCVALICSHLGLRYQERQLIQSFTTKVEEKSCAAIAFAWLTEVFYGLSLTSLVLSMCAAAYFVFSVLAERSQQ